MDAIEPMRFEQFPSGLLSIFFILGLCLLFVFIERRLQYRNKSAKNIKSSNQETKLLSFIKFECPQCRQKYEVSEEFLEKRVQCEKCNTSFIIENATKRCPMCREEILAVAKKCKHCGEYLNDDGTVAHRSDRIVYILLALFLGGLGLHNLYAKQNSRAYMNICFFITTIILFAAFPREGAWFLPAVINTILVLFDICHDPNNCNKNNFKRKTILGVSPLLFVFGIISLLVFIISLVKSL